MATVRYLLTSSSDLSSNDLVMIWGWHDGDAYDKVTQITTSKVPESGLAGLKLLLSCGSMALILSQNPVIPCSKWSCPELIRMMATMIMRHGLYGGCIPSNWPYPPKRVYPNTKTTMATSTSVSSACSELAMTLVKAYTNQHDKGMSSNDTNAIK